MSRRKIEIEYRLPKDVYMSTLWKIKGYRRLKAEYNQLLDESPAPADGMPHGHNASDEPMFTKVIKLVDISQQLDPIEKALLKIPQEYQKGIFCKIVDGEEYPDTANRKTWQLWRQRYIYHVAVAFGYMPVE